MEQLTAAAEAESRRVQAVLSSFPADERAVAWTMERGALSNPRLLESTERRFRAELFGPDFEEDVSWMTRLNHWLVAGADLRDEWRAWREGQAVAGALCVARNPELERAILRAPYDDDGLCLIYADWLLDQPGGRGLGEYIQLALAGPEVWWRAELLLELDPEVSGPPFNRDATWDNGFLSSAMVNARALAVALEHPAAFMMRQLHVTLDSDVPLQLGPGPYALRELTIATPEETSPDVERTIKLLVDVAPRFPMLEQIDFSEGDFEPQLHRVEAAFPGAQVTYDTAIEGE